jgi:hypothetical protein
LPCSSCAVQEKLVCLVDGLCWNNGCERYNGFVVEKSHVCSRVGSGVVNGGVGNVGIRGSSVTEGRLAVYFLIESISCHAESVIMCRLVQLYEHRVSTAMGESHCLEKLLEWVIETC